MQKTGDLNQQKGDSIRILLIEDNPTDAHLILEMLKGVGKVDLHVDHATTLREGLEHLSQPEKALDVVLLDLGLPDSQGLETFQSFRNQAKRFTTIILSGLDDVDFALDAVREGAKDYLVKGQINGNMLLHSIRHAIERDDSERLLRESQERYQNLVEVMPDAIIVHSNERIVFANPAALKLLGASVAKDLLGKNMLGLVHSDFHHIVSARMSALQEGGSQPTLEEKFIRLDGKVIDVEVAGTQLIFEDQPATQLIIRDIANRKQRERELEAMAMVSQHLRSALTREEIIPIILDQAISSMSAQDGMITIEDPSTGNQLIVLGRGLAATAMGMYIPIGTGVTSLVSSTGQPYLNNHARSQPDSRMVLPKDLKTAQVGTMSFESGTGLPFLSKHSTVQRDPERVRQKLGPTEAMLIVPILAEDRVIGTMAIGREHAFEDSDVRVLNAISNIGGSAIHRATLLEQTERRLRQLHSLRQIDTAIASSLALDFSLDVILTQTVNELKVDAASILLLNSQQILEYAAGRGFRTELAKTAKLKFGEGLAGKVAKDRALVAAPVIDETLPEYTLNALLKPEGFTSYYGAPLIAKGKVIGVIETFHRSDQLRDAEWKDFLQTLAGQAAIAIDNATLFQDLQHSNQDLRRAYDRTIEGWAHALSLRDMETVEHSRRVTEMTLQLARAIGMDEEKLVHVRRGALLHDIGKMSIPDKVLGKTGPLDESEWVTMRKHPEYASQMLSTIEFLRPALPIPTAHHEKWDGSGYPLGLKGKQIPLEARIFAVVDVWDALNSNRPYRSALPEEKVRKYLHEQSGKHFDPEVVDAFFKNILKEAASQPIAPQV